MKRLLLFTTLFTLFGFTMLARNDSKIDVILKDYAVKKVTSMQQLIEFNNTQYAKLVVIEFEYLTALKCIECSVFCNKQRRIEKLEVKRDNALHKILLREQYIKYKSIEEKSIKRMPLQAS